MSKKLTTIQQLKTALGQVKNMIANVAAVAADAITELSNAKADKGHKHTKSDITDFPTSMPASDVPSWAKNATKPSYTASEVGARPSTWTPTATQVGAVPTTRKVNNKALSGDISLSSDDILLPDGVTTVSAALSQKAISNPNILDNWYFPDPINQANIESGWLWSDFYGIDRWMNYSVNDIKWVKGEGIWLMSNPPEVAPATIDQRIESDRIPLGSTVTLSILVGGYLLSATFQVSAGTRHYKAVSIDDISVRLELRTDFPGNGVYAVRVSDPTQDILIKAIKLEFGDHQTLARQDASGNWVLNDPPPNKALELAKCQRYFYRMTKADTMGYTPLFSGAVYRPQQLDGMVTFPVTMRANPAFSCSGQAKLFYSNGLFVPCTINPLTPARYGYLLRAIVDTEIDLTEVKAAMVEMTTDGGYLEFDANL